MFNEYDDIYDHSHTTKHLIDYRTNPNAIVGILELVHECHKCRNLGCDYVAWEPCTCSYAIAEFDQQTLPPDYSDITRIKNYLQSRKQRKDKYLSRKLKEQRLNNLKEYATSKYRESLEVVKHGTPAIPHLVGITQYRSKKVLVKKGIYRIRSSARIGNEAYHHRLLVQADYKWNPQTKWYDRVSPYTQCP
jgi:hypothetical protein